MLSLNFDGSSQIWSWLARDDSGVAVLIRQPNLVPLRYSALLTTRSRFGSSVLQSHFRVIDGADQRPRDSAGAALVIMSWNLDLMGASAAQHSMHKQVAQERYSDAAPPCALRACIR